MSRGMRCIPDSLTALVGCWVWVREAQIVPCGRTTQAICNAEAAPAKRWINAQIMAVRNIKVPTAPSAHPNYTMQPVIAIDNLTK
jgi:hypothetical protein